MISSITLALALIAGPMADEGQARPFLHPPVHPTTSSSSATCRCPIWGWAEPGQRIKVVLAGQSVETTADAQGKWLAKLGPYPAGGPHVLVTVTGAEVGRGQGHPRRRRLGLLGPVEHGMAALEATPINPQEIASANHPRIRLFTVPKKIATRADHDRGRLVAGLLAPEVAAGSRRSATSSAANSSGNSTCRSA